MHFNTTEKFRAVFSKNINNLQSWTFFSEKPLSPQINIVCKALSFWQKKICQIQHCYRGIRWRIWNLKNWAISWIYWISNFCLNKLSPGLWLALSKRGFAEGVLQVGWFTVLRFKSLKKKQCAAKLLFAAWEKF